MKKSPYLKYRNPDKRCQYPWTNGPVGYCWLYAGKVDEKATKKEIEKFCSKCDMWKKEQQKNEK